MRIEELTKGLTTYNPSDIIFVGLGNEFRDDDVAGLKFMEEIMRLPVFKSSHFIRAGRTPENYLQEILAYEGKIVIFIDTVKKSDEKEFFFLDEKDIELNQLSTHSYSILLVEKYLKTVQDLECKYIGVPA